MGVKMRNSLGQPEYQFEKFLFYRGLGTFSLPLQVGSSESPCGDLIMHLRNGDAQPLRSLFAAWVEKDAIRFAPLGDLAAKASRNIALQDALKSSLPLSEGVPRAKEAVKAALIAAGLYAKEAQAMVNTWEKSYFRTEGLRLLYLLPRKSVDQVIPIQIQPAPDHLVRVMVGRVEVLSPERRAANR